MKFGGSSLADTEKVRFVAQKIANRHNAGDRVVAVVSAQGKTTDQLMKMAGEISPNPHKRELDMLLTAGERISMALLAMAIKDLGVNAISFTGSQCGIITNDNHFNAKILEVRPYRVYDELEKGQVVIVAGFQGVSYKKEITTLGRGGSDTTAVALAAALNASTCEIYSDVDGVYTADPRLVDPFRLVELGYDEMMEMAYRGAKVLNYHAVEFARRSNIAIYARSTYGGNETVVRDSTPPNGVTAISSIPNLGTIRIFSFEDIDKSFQLLKSLDISPKYTVFSKNSGFVFIDTTFYPDWNHHQINFSDTSTCSAVSIIGTASSASDILIPALEIIQNNGDQVLCVETGHSHMTFYLDFPDPSRYIKLFHEKFLKNQ